MTSGPPPSTDLGELVPPTFVVVHLRVPSEGGLVVRKNLPTEVKDVEKRVVIEDANVAKSRRPYLLS